MDGRGRASFFSFARGPHRRRLILRVVLGAFRFTVPFAASELPSDSLQGFLSDAIAPFLPVVGVGLVVRLGSRLVRKRPQLGLGVYTWTWYGRCFFAWDSIGTVEPSARKGLTVELDVGELPGHRETDPEENWLARLLDSRRRQERLRLGHLQIDPAAVHAALAFYRENPSARNELGTEVATGRIRRCDFELEWTEA